MSRLEIFQQTVGEWGDQTFPLSTRETVLAHFLEEALEFYGVPHSSIEHIRAYCDEVRELPGGELEEGADCFLLLLHYFHKSGQALSIHAGAKMSLLRSRTWKTQPEPAGHFKHEETPS